MARHIPTSGIGVMSAVLPVLRGQPEQEVDIIRYHNEGVGHQVRPFVRGAYPLGLRDLTKGTQRKTTLDDLAEHERLVLGTDGHEVLSTIRRGGSRS